MGKYRTINVDLNRQYRNDLNWNFEQIENDIRKADSEISRVEAESKERDNLLAGTDVQAVIDRINTSADNADVQAQHAKSQGDFAKTQGDYAKKQGDFAQSKGNYADEKAVLADEAADAAYQEASNLSQLKIDVTTATQEANSSAINANTQAIFAQEQGNRARDIVDEIVYVANRNIDGGNANSIYTSYQYIDGGGA